MRVDYPLYSFGWCHNITIFEKKNRPKADANSGNVADCLLRFRDRNLCYSTYTYIPVILLQSLWLGDVADCGCLWNTFPHLNKYSTNYMLQTGRHHNVFEAWALQQPVGAPVHDAPWWDLAYVARRGFPAVHRHIRSYARLFRGNV